MQNTSSHTHSSIPAELFMVVEISNFLNRLESNQYSIFTQKFHSSACKTFANFRGNILSQDDNSYLVKFQSATDAVLCALRLEQKFKYVTPRFDQGNRRLKIGVSAQTAATDTIDQKVIQEATWMCEVVKDTIVISQPVRKLYEKENRNARIDQDHIRVLKTRDAEFLNRLMDSSQRIWEQGSLNLDHLRSALGYSRSSFYRRIKKLTGLSPHYFIREFRLQRAINMLHKRRGTISKIASETGFKNASHFARCFSEKFGLLPSKYSQHYAT